MCGGGGGGGPSSKEKRQQKQWQRKVQKRQNKQFRRAQSNARELHDANMAFNMAQYEQGREDSWAQFNIAQQNQMAMAEWQMASQEAQFAAAQAAQEQQLMMQMEQNERMAAESEKAANRAMGLKLVGQDPDAVKVKSNIKKKNRRKQAARGTTQLTNPLTISLGGQ